LEEHHLGQQKNFVEERLGFGVIVDSRKGTGFLSLARKCRAFSRLSARVNSRKEEGGT
jgi:hypothetical protein